MSDAFKRVVDALTETPLRPAKSGQNYGTLPKGSKKGKEFNPGSNSKQDGESHQDMVNRQSRRSAEAKRVETQKYLKHISKLAGMMYFEGSEQDDFIDGLDKCQAALDSAADRTQGEE